MPIRRGMSPFTRMTSYFLRQTGVSPDVKVMGRKMYPLILEPLYKTNGYPKTNTDNIFHANFVRFMGHLKAYFWDMPLSILDGFGEFLKTRYRQLADNDRYHAVQKRRLILEDKIEAFNRGLKDKPITRISGKAFKLDVQNKRSVPVKFQYTLSHPKFIKILKDKPVWVKLSKFTKAYDFIPNSFSPKKRKQKKPPFP